MTKEVYQDPQEVFVARVERENTHTLTLIVIVHKRTSDYIRFVF